MPTSTTVAEATSSAVLSPKVWLAPYALVVSTLYLWGYWGAFDINVLDYIGLSDIVKTSVYPLVSAFAAMAIGALLGEVVFPRPEPGAGANSPIGRLLRKYAPYLVACYVALMMCLAFFGGANKWHVVPVMMAMFAYLPAKSSGLLEKEIPMDGLRSIAVFLLVALVPYAYGHGRFQANAVVESSKFQVVVSELPLRRGTTDLAIAEKPRFIGKLGDRFAVYDPVAHSVSLIAASEIKVLTLADSEVLSKAAPPAATPASAPAPIPDDVRPPDGEDPDQKPFLHGWQSWGNFVLKGVSGAGSETISRLQAEAAILAEVRPTAFPRLLYDNLFYENPVTDERLNERLYVTVEEFIDSKPLNEVMDQ